jgi:hypothetical protein
MTQFDTETGEITATPIDIETSPQFGEIAAAIAAAQAEIDNAEKDAKNPHFNSKYATLASVYAACRPALSKHKVAVIQVPFNLPEGDIGIATLLAHPSGQWIKGRLYCKPAKYDAHGVGSVLTYMRRYSLSAMVGVAPEDDDGNAGVGKPSTQTSPQHRSGGQHQASQAEGGQSAAAKKDRIQGLYNAISKEIAEALDHADLDDLPFRRESDLLEIKEYSLKHWETLRDRAMKRKHQITDGPGKTDALAEAEPRI